MLAAGSTAPSFQLESSDGGTASLDGLSGQIVVLYFYPRDNTPGCTVEAQDFRDHLAQFKAAGAAVFGVSKDSIASHCKFRDKYGLTFPLLTDPDGKVMERFEAWGEKVMYGKRITGIIRSTVVIDQNGKVAKHWPKVNVKGHAADVLAFVQSLGGREGGSGGGAKKESKGKAEGGEAEGKKGKAKATPGKAVKAAPVKAAPVKAGKAKAAPVKAAPVAPVKAVKAALEKAVKAAPVKAVKAALVKAANKAKAVLTKTVAPAAKAKKPAPSAKKPAPPAKKPVAPAKKPAAPAKKPAAPAKKPVVSAAKAKKPAAKPGKRR